MFVCLCAGVTDTEILECSQDGCTLDELKLKLNVSQVCGCCSEEVSSLYNASLQKQINVQNVIKHKI